MSGTAVIIPFRDRGIDPRRSANLEIVMAWWWAFGLQPRLTDDGLDAEQPFNRHLAYNRAVESCNADTFVFTEADMLLPVEQVAEAVGLAESEPGLVVPFTRYRYLSDERTAQVRDDYHDLSREEVADWWHQPIDSHHSIFQAPAEFVMKEKRSVGAVNVVSRETLEITGGYTEATSGNWYDDNIINEGFAYLTKNPTRYVSGPAVHLYHLPGQKGDHITARDRMATAHNKDLLIRMRTDIRMNERGAVRNLMTYRKADR